MEAPGYTAMRKYQRYLS